MAGELFVVVLNLHGLEVFGLEDLAAVQAFYVFDAIAPGYHLCPGVVASRKHKQRLDEDYFNRLIRVVKPPPGDRFGAHRCGELQFLRMPFPTHRMRRLRSTEAIRGLVRETRLHPGQFILPLFVCPGEGVRREIGSMPDNFQLSIDEMVKECEEIRSLGIGGVILFGLPESKDDMASGAYDDNGIVQRAIRAIRREVPGLLIMTDVCNCEYTSHGHCGYVKDGDVDNDVTLQWLAKSAVSHARAGADIVAPSDMMDGRVWAIRQALDANGYESTPILAYAAKLASEF
jgi:delta-aminolevulinic acid dehydratase/porphobilinogen synthase